MYKLILLLASTFIFSQVQKDSLKKEEQVLQEVWIKENKKFIKTEADKTTYLIKNNPLLSTGMIYDAVKRLPGVLVNPTGGLSMNGKNTMVYIDGNPSSLSGQDLMNYIQSLPANTVEKIELISNPGAMYEANTSGGIINIITHGKTLKGLNGTLNLHYGMNKNQKPSPSIILNGRVKSINWQVQTGYNYHEADNLTINSQTFTSFSPQVLFTQRNTSDFINRNFYLRPMVNFKLNKNSNLILNYNLNTANNSTDYFSTSDAQNYTSPVLLTNNSFNSNKNNNHEFIAKYKTKLDTLGKNLQLTAYYNLYDKNTTSNSIQNQDNINTYGINKLNLNLNNFYVKYDVELPFKKSKTTLNTGGKFNTLNATSLGNYNLNNSSNTILNNPIYTDQLDFDYQEINYALYAELKRKFGKLNITAGLRMEDLQYKSYVPETDTRVDKHINNFFPTFHALYELMPNVNAITSYTRKINLPAYSYLDPNNFSYFDRYTSTVGNQFLQPNFYDNYSFKISAFDWVQLGVDYSYSKDVNLFTYETQEKNINSIQTFRSYDAIKYTSIYASIPVPFGLITKGKDFFKQPMDMDNMSALFFNVSYNNHKVSNFDYVIAQKPFWQFYIQSQIILPYKFKLSFDYLYVTKGTYEVYQIEKPYQYSSLDISRKFLNNKLTASVNIQDIFNTLEVNAKIPSPNLNVNSHRKDDSRVFWLKLTYNFGKLKTTEQTEINTEKKQIEGNGTGINIK